MVSSRVALLSRWIGLVALALFVGVPALTATGLAGPGAFRLFTLGVLLGLVAFVLGVIGLARTTAASGRSGRPAAVAGTAIGAGVLAVTLLAAAPWRGEPPINDITTDPDDPPAFSALAAVPANRDRDMGYPPEFEAPQRAAYPDLDTIELDAPPGETLDRVEARMRELGWDVVARDDEAGTVEATWTSRIFRFVDDIVVRVRPGPGGGSRVDVRSKSRLGRGDLGANAAKIRRLRDALTGA